MEINDLRKILNHLYNSPIDAECFDFGPAYDSILKERKEIIKMLKEEIKKERDPKLAGLNSIFWRHPDAVADFNRKLAEEVAEFKPVNNSPEAVRTKLKELNEKREKNRNAPK